MATLTYAGIGARATPASVLADMTVMSGWLARTGWHLSSGGADGADSAFAAGAPAGQRTVWLPWRAFNGRRGPDYPLSRQEQAALARRIHAHVAERGHQTDAFGSYTDENFLEFFDPERPALHRRLVAQVAEAARELCRAGQFDPKIILHAIQACKEDPEWRAAYARFVGGDIYQTGNELKQQINREFGRSVKAATRAHVQKDERGRPIRDSVEDEIIQSYTLLKK